MQFDYFYGSQAEQFSFYGWVDHGPAGLKLILTNEEGRFERRLPWRAAAKRISYLIEMQRFLTPQELEQYPAWAAEQREVASVARDEPGNVPDTRPICAEGSVVYLEDDHRFTVERIGQFDVHLRDEEVPLFGRAISREEFQRQLLPIFSSQKRVEMSILSGFLHSLQWFGPQKLPRYFQA